MLGFGKDKGKSGGTGKLIPLQPLARRHALLSEALAYWEALRAGRDVPLRADLNPRGLERALDQALLLERIAPGHARIRLAGQKVSALLGIELRGMPLSVLFTPDQRAPLAETLERVFSGPEIADIALRSDGAYGRPVLTGRLLLLPLRSDLGDITRALGVLVTEGDLGRVPRRFNEAQTTRMRIAAGLPATRIDPRPDIAGIAAPGPATLPGLAEPPAPFAPPPRPTGKPVLRVIRGDRDKG